MSDAKKSILIAEDEQSMAKILTKKLQASGYEAKAVSDGQEAVDELSKTKYNLLLLDLLMPKMDGFTVLSKLKEKGISVTVIVTSNLGQEEDIKKAKALGAKDYLVKANVSLAQIIEKVKSHLG